MKYSLKTHQGKRKDNQDYAGMFFNEKGLLLAVLCDGLGGHQAGDIASEMAVSQIGNAWEGTDFTAQDTYLVQNWLKEKINKENSRIYEAASTYSDLEGMGTTLVASVILKENVLFSNVGDSRAYIYFNNQIELVTEDHSFVSELQRKGALTDLEALNHYNRNALTRSLGVEGPVDVDFFKRLINKVDVIMLNSDGLSNAVSENEMLEILKQTDLSLEQRAELLVNKAIENEGSDNITVSLIDVNAASDHKVGEER